MISTVTGDSKRLFVPRTDQATGRRPAKSRLWRFPSANASCAGWTVGKLAGHLAARNYFQSVKSAENDAFIKMWTDFNEQRDKTTNDPMEATFIGFRMWAQAVSQAGTTDVNAVRQAMYGQTGKGTERL